MIFFMHQCYDKNVLNIAYSWLTKRKPQPQITVTIYELPPRNGKDGPQLELSGARDKLFFRNLTTRFWRLLVFFYSVFQLKGTLVF